MDIFGKWSWIKRNWSYILEEAEKLGLVFVGGTALNLVLFDEYRASEDIDLYNPDSKGVDNASGKSEAELVADLANRLTQKGFEIQRAEGRFMYAGPSVKIEIFNDGTRFHKIEKIRKNDVRISVFDRPTYMEMKLSALLCRTLYDARDLVDVFVLSSRGNLKQVFPDRECEVLENSLRARIHDIQKTERKNLLLFQSREQSDALPFSEFDRFRRGLVDWLSKFS